MTHCLRTAGSGNLRPISSGRILALAVVFPLALAACGDDGGAAPPEGPTTVAYAVTQCTDGPAGVVAQQSFRIRHGNQEVTVAEFGPLHLPSSYGLCSDFGLFRLGSQSIRVFPIQRVGVTFDGSTVVFEVTDDFSLLLPNQLVPPEQEGIYVVHADGSGLRRLGPASRDPVGITSLIAPFFGFSADGRTVVFTDLDPQDPDPDAPQIVALDLITGARPVLTHLPPVALPENDLRTVVPVFLDAETVAFRTHANPDGTNPENKTTWFTVGTDGTGDLTPVPVIALPGATVLPNFSITSPDPIAVEFPVSGPSGDVAFEAFLFDTNPSQVLQLTNFGRLDTAYPRVTADRQRVLFIASADPVGENPDNNCEFFSIDWIGTNLRQLTHIGEGGQRGCDRYGFDSPGCSITLVRVDPLTGWVTFDSDCDPFGTNPSGGQVFTMRPDGSELRQLTATRGMTTEADDTVNVELPGPWGSPTRGF
jgi:Tol biopolymer transport system component